MSRRKRSVKKSPKNGLILLIIIALGIGVFFGYRHYSKIGEAEKVNVEQVLLALEDLLPKETNSRIDLPTTLSEYENITISWSSSDEKVITLNGEVTRPNYLSGDKKVSLIATIYLFEDNPLTAYIMSLLGYSSISKTFNIKVIRLDPTDEEKLNIVADFLYVPETTNKDVGLVQEINLFDGMAISWESTNPLAISNLGEKLAVGESELIATISINDKIKEVRFPIRVTDDEFTVAKIDENFDNLKNSSYSNDFETTQLKFHQAITSNQRLRIDADQSGYVVMKNDINNVHLISFDYQLFNNVSFTKKVSLNVYYSYNQGNTWELYKEFKVENTELNQVHLDLASLQSPVRLKIVAETDYSDLIIELDNLKIIRFINNIDITTSLESMVPSSVKSSLILPTTTRYGGKVSWVSSHDDLLSSTGIVNRPEKTTEVTLTATITGFDEIITSSVKVNVSGVDEVTPLEVFFIDIGKYGTSDNGESIYIKLGDIDILVDAGDNIETTKKAISEVIDANSNDKIIDYVIATHPDADHIGGMKYIFDTYQILNLLQFEGTHTTNLYQNYVKAVSEEGLLTECTALEAYNNVGNCQRKIDLGDDVFIEIVNTTFYETTETNGRSIVFVLEAYGTRILLTGDADNGSGRQLESAYMNTVGDIDILKAVHHATKEGTTSEFLEVVQPEVVIITNGNYFGNKHGHPTAEAINRIYQYNDKTKVYAVVGGDVNECSVTTSYKCEISDPMVDRNGTILVTVNQDGYQIFAEYYNIPLELSSTNFWKTHPSREYSYNK